VATDINTLLTDSLIYVGAYAQGQTANSDDLSLAFRVINRKLDSLSAEKLTMVGMGRLTGQLTGQPSYGLGPGLAWGASARPIKIKSASTLALNNTERPARIATADQWAQVPDKSRTGVFVEDLFYDNGFPTGFCYVSPMPASGQIILWVFQAIPQLPGQTGTVNFAPGYEQAILTVAAAELCIAFQRPLTEELAASAAQSKDVIIQLNAELFDAPMPAPAGPSPVSPPAIKTT
jgi:hypothetical protein